MREKSVYIKSNARKRRTCEWNSWCVCGEHETSSFFARIEYQRARWQPPFMPPRWLNIFTCSITQAEVRARPIVLRAPPRWIYVRAVFAIVAAASAKFLLFDRPTLSHQRLRERGTCWRFWKLSVGTHVKCVTLNYLNLTCRWLCINWHTLSCLSDILSAGSRKTEQGTSFWFLCFPAT